MFSPEMMQAAQGMMANMSPEDMKRMSDWAANMDPSMMDNMMKSMGGNAGGVDPKKAAEQMKNMSPEQLRAGMTQAQNQMSAQKQYMFNAAVMLKNEGNTHIKGEKYAEALKVYTKALENITPHAGDDVVQLRLSLLLNSALCHLKQKDFKQAVETSEQALRISTNNVKALFRRGLARFELGELADAVADVKLAAKLSPEDKAIGAELARLEKEGRSLGLSAKDLEAAERRASELAAAPRVQPGGGGSSSSSSTSPGPSGATPSMSEAVDRLAKNPEMLEQATQMMKNMPKEDLERMMRHAPLPPGMDIATLQSQMEAVSKNPDMLKSAVENLKAMPAEDRKRLLSQQGLHSGDLADMGKVLENPEMLKQVAQIATASGQADSGQAEMMLKAAEMMSANPELGQQMSNMLKSMPPDQLQKMMEMSTKMRGGPGGGGGADGPMGSMDMDAMSSMMSDPQMMKAAEEMMKSMTPETLAAMAKSSGIDLDEDKARMLSRLMPLMPWVLRAMRLFNYVRKPFQLVFTSRGRVVLAVVVLLVAILQHYYYNK